jgi:hypothetical protein
VTPYNKDNISLFQPNQVIYIGGGIRGTNTKEDTSKNYKVVSYKSYNTDLKDKDRGPDPKDFPLIVSHFNNILYEEEEFNYCKDASLNKCEIFEKSDNELLLAIVDITRDVHDSSTLVQKTRCKRLKKSLITRFNKLTKPNKINQLLLGVLIGGTKRKNGKSAGGIFAHPCTKKFGPSAIRRRTSADGNSPSAGR